MPWEECEEDNDDSSAVSGRVQFDVSGGSIGGSIGGSGRFSTGGDSDNGVGGGSVSTQDAQAGG